MSEDPQTLVCAAAKNEPRHFPPSLPPPRSTPSSFSLSAFPISALPALSALPASAFRFTIPTETPASGLRKSPLLRVPQRPLRLRGKLLDPENHEIEDAD